MPRTTAFRRGDVVLVEFVFSDEPGAKLRPALVVSSDGYHRDRREAIIAAITSHVGRRLVGDHPISDWKEAGLFRDWTAHRRRSGAGQPPARR
jgi:mRNA interferase MazF